jgi:hypothetical protein
MTDPITPIVIDDILELMELVKLVAIRPFEISSVFVPLQAESDGPTAEPGAEPAAPEVNLEYSEFLNETEIHTRFRLTLVDTDVTYVADMASIYQTSEPVVISRPVVVDFAERVGFMATFPYLRESISTSAARMGRPAPLMGLMRPGDFKIQPPETVMQPSSSGD